MTVWVFTLTRNGEQVRVEADEPFHAESKFRELHPGEEYTMAEDKHHTIRREVERILGSRR